jgi:hypothetical protein
LRHDTSDPDLEQVVQPIRVKLIAADAADDATDGVPIDPDHPADRALIGPGRQPRDELLEIAGEPAGVPSERHALDPDPVLRALEPPQLGAELQAPDPQIQVPPDRLDVLQVVAVRRGETTQRATKTPAPKRQVDRDPVLVEADTANPDPVQAQQPRESRVDAHRRPPVELMTFKQPAACRAGTAGASPFTASRRQPHPCPVSPPSMPASDPLSQRPHTATSTRPIPAATSTSRSDPRTPRTHSGSQDPVTYIDA